MTKEELVDLITASTEMQIRVSKIGLTESQIHIVKEILRDQIMFYNVVRKGDK